MATTSETQPKREVWSSRTAFLFASLGCAVGFGNVWRFPTLAYEYGGGAFLIPYFLALVLIGLPLLMMEISLGQHYLAGDVGVFGKINPRFRGIGISSSLNSFIVVCYYAMLIGWTVRCFVSAFTNPGSWSLYDGDEAFSHFVNVIVGMESLENGNDSRPTRIVIYNVCCLAVVWLAIFFGTAYGLEWTGKITYISMGVPLVLMVVLLIRAVTLEGSGIGIHAYIGAWELQVLIDHPDVWSTAVSQIFFSLGVTFGMFTAFGSHCPRSAPAFENSVVIAICNSAFSIISGFTIFGALGYLAHEQNMDIQDVVVGGPALIFGAYPDVLETLPGGIFWVRLFFFDMFLLGIDSSFAIIEAIITVLKDTPWLRSRSTYDVSAGVCTMGFLCGVMYSTDAGLYFLDVVDFYVNFIMILVGMLECVAVGWFFGLERQYELLGERTVNIYMTTSCASILVASFFWFGIANGAATFWSGFVLFVAIYAAGLVVAIRTFRQTKGLVIDDTDPTVPSYNVNLQWSDLDIAKTIMLRNVYDLKAELEPTVGVFPLWVAVLIKHFIPHVLWILFVNLAVAKDQGQYLFGQYGGYPTWPFQVLGICVVLLSLSIVIVGLIIPEVFDSFSGGTNEDNAASDKSIELTGHATTNSNSEQDEYKLMKPDQHNDNALGNVQTQKVVS
mmetsp:Transcript_7645/g.10004  ORF Transcript_7645/g.10004 Transcript_7645/m.10004 type:complete len:671 (-) Transcript_7645:438-2450(-)|eukprot:CAMPEP_0198152620 /NCGR_PEP_ID=MMETSP1443-20131203/60590_1 /TAXON_ID=186043 /ORGANISM="Entomoneis sp., Strain CCMP2396" /LENGTH=670 /DNA_ID=CAMNT_0043818707 /DNA_START=133 /DNA_END=2145 /DNA_ORIENTATION=-